MTLEGLHPCGIDTNTLLEHTRGWRLLRDVALAMAANHKIRVTNGKTGGGAIELVDLERVSKMGRIAVMCMVEDVAVLRSNVRQL